MLAITSLDMDEPGSYALARAAEWAADTEMVTAWRGPDKHDESFARNTLEEMECSTIWVDDAGFFTCPNPIYNEELQEIVKEKAEELLDEEANEQAAMSLSYAEPMAEKYGPDVFVVATFGDAVAVDGETWDGDRDPKPPRGWEKVNDGGYIPSGEEAEIEKASLAERLSFIVSKELKRSVSIDVIIQILNLVFEDERDYMYWSSDSGEAEVWVSPAAFEAYEKDDKELRERQWRQRLKANQEARERRQGERRAKIKAGGWPKAKDWSPKGELPDN